MLVGTGRRPVVVSVGRTALSQMLMATIEAIVVPPLMTEESERKLHDLERVRRRRPEVFQRMPMSLLSSQSGLPVAGLLLGTEAEGDTGVTLKVEEMVGRSANRSDTAIWTHPSSPTVIAGVAEVAGVGMEVVGNFRSRPLLDYTADEIEFSRLYQWQRSPDTAPEFLGDRVSIALTITRHTPRKRQESRHPASVVPLQIGGWEVWVAAHLPDRRTPTQGPELVIDAPYFPVRGTGNL